jgi:hypothetical protein
MRSEIEELIQKLRKAEERQHAANLEAIDTLEKNMLGSGGPAVNDVPIGGGEQAGERSPGEHADEATAEEVSNVDCVLNVLDAQEFTPLSDIVEATGLDEAKVRAVLYSRSLRSRIKKRKVNKRFAFRLIVAPELTVRKAQKLQGKGPSAADRVRAVLGEHPDGLRAAEIRELLPDIGVNTIGATLYNMKKKSKKVIHDESAGTYRLA